MPVPASQFLSATSINSNIVHRPIITNVVESRGFTQSQRVFTSLYKQFWRWFVRSPELVATINIPITDIIGDRPSWTDPEGKQLNKQQLKKAVKFWRDNRGKETVKAWLYDAFVTGDAYLWLAMPENKDIRRAMKEVLKRNHGDIQLPKSNSLQFKELLIKASMDEDLKKPKSFDYVASSTMTIIHDQFEIRSYEQLSNGLTAVFSPEEIIHFRYMTMNGLVTGFSPIESLASEIVLLSLVKTNMLAFMRNGGSPDKMFVLPKEIASSPNHLFLIQTLQKYRKIENRHGNLVLTGEINVEDLQGSPKDLEYKDLALYITSNIAYAYGIPVTRIPYLIGTSANKGDSGGLSETGYWNMISSFQDSMEDLLNSQLFDKFGWKINFDRKYKQDEVREAQALSQSTDNITKMQQILAKNKMQMTDEKIMDMLELAEDQTEEFKPGFGEEENNPLQNQNQLDNRQIMTSTNQQKKDDVKRNSANQKGTKGAVVPGGGS